MATKKKAVKKVANKSALKKATKPTKKTVKKEVKKPVTKKATKPAKKVKVVSIKQKPTSKGKPLTKTASNVKIKTTNKTAAVKKGTTSAPVKAKAPQKVAPAKLKKNVSKSVEVEKPIKKLKNSGPESVANVSFHKTEKLATRATAKQKIKVNTDTRTKYSDAELEEFRLLIEEKLTAARNELKYLHDQINRKDDNGTDDTENKFANMEDGTLSQEREYLTQMAARQVQYIENLEKALVRIKNKTYGICRVTGKLIDKERLRIVPHATLSMEAKMLQK